MKEQYLLCFQGNANYFKQMDLFVLMNQV